MLHAVRKPDLSEGGAADGKARTATGVLAICGGSDLTPEFPELKLISAERLARWSA